MASRRFVLHAALYALPTLAIASVLALTLTSSSDPPVGVRIYGGPPGPDRILAWRVTAAKTARGIYTPLANTPLRLTVAVGALESTVEGQTDAQAAWETHIRLPDYPVQSVEMRLYAPPNPKPLSSGTVPVAPPAWQASFERLPTQLEGRSSGQLRMKVSLMRGTLATGFAEEALIEVNQAQSASPLGHARLRFNAEGLEVEPAAEVYSDAQGQARVKLRPTHHAPLLNIQAVGPSGEQGSWECALPVVPGGLWLDDQKARQGLLSVASPVRHSVAHYTLFSPQARLAGGTIPLEPDPSGGAVGQVPMPPLPPGQSEVWALISPDPPELSPDNKLTAWPLARASTPDPRAEPAPAARARTLLLFDGMQDALSAVYQRSMRARLQLVGIIAAAALLEAGLLFWRARQAKTELQEFLRLHVQADETTLRQLSGGQTFWLRLLIAALLLAAGFGSVALVTWLNA